MHETSQPLDVDSTSPHIETQMLRLECKVCEMSTTSVDTPSLWKLWYDHMGIHSDPEAFGVWSWSVMQLHL